jgi:hypothetical protein
MAEAKRGMLRYFDICAFVFVFLRELVGIVVRVSLPETSNEPRLAVDEASR